MEFEQAEIKLSLHKLTPLTTHFVRGIFLAFKTAFLALLYSFFNFLLNSDIKKE